MGFKKPSRQSPSDSIPDPALKSRRSVEQDLGEDGRLMDSKKVLKSISTEVYYFRTSQAFFVWSDSDSQSGASRYGKRVRNNFIARSKLKSDAPPVHDWTMYVGYDGGYVKIDPEIRTKQRQRRGPSVRDQKNSMLDRASDIFGKKVRIKGSKGLWEIVVRPEKNEFKPFSFPFSTFEEGQKKLELAIKMFGEGKLSGKVGKVVKIAKFLVSGESTYIDDIAVQISEQSGLSIE